MVSSARMARIAVCTAFVVLFSWVRSAHAAPQKPVPDALKAWVPWVLEGKEERLCTPTFGAPDARTCVWPSRLELTLGDKGGSFRQSFHLDAKAIVPLPGDAKRFPLDVTLNGKKGTAISQANGHPAMALEAGDHTVTGVFAWDALPESLAIPKETALLALTMRGLVVPTPKRTEEGTLWLQHDAVVEEGERLDIVVHRRLTDDVPLLLTTRVLLSVAGKSREAVLGKPLPKGFVPMAMESSLPARIDSDGRLRVQLRPGSFTIELTARSEGPVSELRRPNPEGPWREGDEVWVFEARPETRVVSIEGVSAIDPAQTSLPEAWKKLPTYSMNKDDAMQLAEKRRGDADPPPDQLALVRTLWLDFEGTGYSIHDTIRGSLFRTSRLEMARPTTLGRVAIGDANQFITHVGDPEVTGVEVRSGTFEVKADSRLDGLVSDIPAVGWKHDFHSVEGTLHVPPGWRLIHASGVDDVPGTWIRDWSLFELFLALISALAVGRLYGPVWGAVALTMLTLTFPEYDAPQWAWASVLAFEALVRVIPEGHVRTAMKVGRHGALVVLLLVAIPFLVTHVREGLYPALGRGSADSESTYAHDAMLEGGTGTRAKGEEGSMGEPAAAVAPEPVEAPPPAPPLAEPETQADKDDAPAPSKAAPVLPGSPPMRSASGGSGSPSPSKQPQKTYASRQLAFDTFDPQAVVQTGPGLPRWTWTTFPLRWSGPVDATQRIHFWLTSPAMNLVLALLRAALIILFVARLLPWFDLFVPPSGKRGLGGKGPQAAVATALLLALSLVSTRAWAQTFPPKEMLDELEKKLLEAPACGERCASLGRLQVDARGRAITLRLDADVTSLVSLPLPGHGEQWSPNEVLVDGKPARALRRSDDGRMHVGLEPGSHEIILRGLAPDGESFQIALPEKPHHASATLDGWVIDGIHEDGITDDALQLSRVQKETAKGEAALEPSALPPFVRVERTLRLGLDWQVETRIVRLTPKSTAVSLEIPLLPGESVTTADVRVAAGKVLVALGPQATETSFRSILAVAPKLRVVATKNPNTSDVVRLEAGPMWHVAATGIPAIHAASVQAKRVPEWRPWPGEVLELTVSRPDGVPGQSVTIDALTYHLEPGLRATDGTVTLELRASRGLQHAVTLPESALLQSLIIDNVAQPVRQEGRTVMIPISPGKQTAVLKFRANEGLTTLYRSLPVDVGLGTVNATIKVTGLGDRWLLLVGGPRLGPVILFWSLLAILLVIGSALSRIHWVPLRTYEWLLLAIGLSQVPIAAAAFVVGWLLALGYRKQWPDIRGGNAAFDARQLLLVVWTLSALAIFVFAVQQGLLGTPSMQLRGNGSSPENLVSYQDRTSPQLPSVWVLSVPMLVYRLAMLAWALWIARAVLRWLKWGWLAFTEGGMWRSSPGSPNVPRPPFQGAPRYGQYGYGPPGAPPGAVVAYGPEQPPFGAAAPSAPEPRAPQEAKADPAKHPSTGDDRKGGSDPTS